MVVYDTLEKLGLTEKEAEIYLACLELGESKIMPIIQKTGMARTSAGYILEQLAKRNIIQIFERNHRRVYVPAPPVVLMRNIRREKENIENKIISLEESLTDLNQIYQSHAFPTQVNFYRGQEEIREIYEEMLREPIDEIWYVGEYSKIVDILGDKYLKNWIKSRVKLHISTKSIRVKGEEVDEPIFQSPKETNRQIKYAPEDFKSPGHISIYGDCVAIITTRKENFGLVIRSREYATMMRNWFRQLWKMAEG